MDDKRPNTGGNKALWFKFWGTDFYDDVGHWTIAQQGAYMRLLWTQWVAGHIPADPADIFEIKNGIEGCWSRLEEKFPLCKDGLRRNGKLERVKADMIDQAEQRSGHAKAAADARWNAKRNAPSMPDAMPEQCPNDAMQEARGKKQDAGSEKPEAESKHTLNGQAVEPVGDAKTKPARISKADLERVWSEFPRKVGKLKAMPAIEKAVRIVSDERGIEPAQSVEFLVGSVQRLSRQSRDKETQYVPHPITWLNQGRYLDPVGAASVPKPDMNTSPVANNAPKLDREEVQSGKAAMLARVMAASPAKIRAAIDHARGTGKASKIIFADDPKDWSSMVLSIVTDAMDTMPAPLKLAGGAA